MKKKSKTQPSPEVEITAFVTLKLVVGLTYDRGRVPNEAQLKRDAVDNFSKHPLLCWPSEFEDLVKECKVEAYYPTQLLRREDIVTMAQGLPIVEDGVCEVDDNAQLSEGSDNGAYVSAWVWVPFEDTKWDKTKPAGRRAAPADCRLKRK